MKVYFLAVSLLLAVTTQAIGQQLGTITTIDVPGVSFTSGQWINPRGDIVGQYISGGVSHGFLLTGGQFASIDVPGASFTYARGINARGEIVGRYVSGGVSHGFLLSEGKFASIDFPGASNTRRSGSTLAARSEVFTPLPV